MITLSLGRAQPTLSHVLCLGAHADDIEIGCGGTILALLEANPSLAVTWVVFSAAGTRVEEARQSAERFLCAANRRDLRFQQFRDGFFPHSGAQIKEVFEELKASTAPDVVFTHYRHDLHQDHRVLSELAWNTFRNHLILEYEIPKYDGDLGVPNLFMPLDEGHCRQKVDILMQCFKSQASKRWFNEEVFRSVLCLRGMECNAPSRYAEAFHARKLVVA